MIKSLIIDDEQIAAAGLTAQLARVAPQVQVGGTAKSVAQAYDLIQSVQPQLIFLDIMLLDGTGFDLLKRFPEASFATIFTTAYDNYAVQAFRFSAIDYLLKPISSEELAHAVQRVLQLQPGAANQKVQQILSNALASPEHRKLAVHEVAGIRYVTVGSIIRIEAESNYSRFILEDGNSILATKGLKTYEELLQPSGFFRCHKSFLVNLRHIVRYLRSKKPLLEMSDGQSVAVARNTRDKLLTLMEAWSI